MLRLVLLSLGAALYVTGAQAHQVHGGCAFGNTHSGEMMHYHPGGYGNAVPCGGGGGYGGGYQGRRLSAVDIGRRLLRRRRSPPPPPDYYGGGGGYRRRRAIVAAMAAAVRAITVRRPTAARIATISAAKEFAARKAGPSRAGNARPIADAEQPAFERDLLSKPLPQGGGFSLCQSIALSKV